MNRLRLGYELKERAAYLLGDIAPHLKGQKFDSEKEYFEFLIKGKIKPEDIKALLMLPYEVSMTEQGNKLILVTGCRSYTGHDEGILKREEISKILFHTHPSYEGHIPVSTPTFSDAVHAKVNKDKVLSLAHPTGIMIYKNPEIDLEQYADQKGVWLEDGEIPSERKDLYTKSYLRLSRQERIKFMRQFAEESGMIVDKAMWHDRGGLERVLAKAFRGIQ